MSAQQAEKAALLEASRQALSEVGELVVAVDAEHRQLINTKASPAQDAIRAELDRLQDRLSEAVAMLSERMNAERRRHTTWRFAVSRTPDGLISEIHATPQESA